MHNTLKPEKKHKRDFGWTYEKIDEIDKIFIEIQHAFILFLLRTKLLCIAILPLKQQKKNQ